VFLVNRFIKTYEYPFFCHNLKLFVFELMRLIDELRQYRDFEEVTDRLDLLDVDGLVVRLEEGLTEKLVGLADNLIYHVVTHVYHRVWHFPTRFELFSIGKGSFHLC